MMTFRFSRLCLRLPCALLVATVAGSVAGTAASTQAATDPDARARAIVSQMTLDEKVLEMHGIGGPSPNIRKVPAVPRLGIPAFVITNGPAGATNGTVSPVPPATALPAPIALAASWDLNAATSYGQVAGSEAKTLGNDLIEGPDMNMARIPQGGRTFENLGEDPFLAGHVAATDIQGIQAQGEIAEAKHYLGNEQEANRFHINDTIDERTLREIYLPPFEASVVQGHAGAVMCAYPQVNGTFSCENATLLNSILKTELGFTGLVTSDFGAVHSTVASATNGLDLEMPSGKFFGSALKSAVQSGSVPTAVLDDHLVRRFRTTMQLGLWDSPPVAHSISSAARKADGATARRIAEAGTVLLKNAGARLPLNAAALHSIAVIGPFATSAVTGGGGSAHVNPLYTVSPVTGIRNRAGSGVTVTSADGSDTTAAANLARAANVAVVMVGDSEAEGHDHPISLSGNQDALVSAVVAANPNTIVVVKSGSAVLMPWAAHVPAIVEAWYPGEEDGNAAAAILFGDFDPSGKLPITFPRQLSDLPANTPSQYPTAAPPAGSVAQAHYSEGLLMGYRHYDAHGIAPLFPFGFGLSYTTFGYQNLKITPAPGHGALVELDVSNTGTRIGAAVAEVYVGMPAAAGEPPAQLKGFQKVHLNPGQTSHVSIALDARAFSHWDSAAHRWAITPGTYTISVGTSSRDFQLQGSITE
jgi:beta-glucosidase